MARMPALARRLAVLVVLLGLLPSCGVATLPYETLEERGHGTPLTRSSHPRSGELTWRPGDVERVGEELRIDLTLTNGSSRDLEQGMLRVILYGPGGEQRSGRLPFGGISRGRTRHVSARFASVPFRVADLGLELIFVVP